jgi:PAS domain S-box-containing protein
MAERTTLTRPTDLRSLEQLVANWPDAVLVYDSDEQRYVIINDAALRLVGYSREEMLRLQPGDLSHPDDAREIPDVIAQAARDGAVRRPWRALRKDGTVVETEMTLTRREIDGRFVSQGIFRALDDGLPPRLGTDGGERDAAYVSAEARLEILERTSLAVVTLDRDGIVTSWNAGAVEQYGIGPDEAIGRPVMELARTEESRTEVAGLMSQHEQRDEWISKMVIRPHNGDPYEAMVTCSVIRADDGEMDGYLFVTAPLESSAPISAPRMRRARVQCAACGREVAGTMRRKYCSEKCRQWAYYHRHLDAQRARSRQRHERRRGDQDDAEPDTAEADGSSGPSTGQV